MAPADVTPPMKRFIGDVRTIIRAGGGELAVTANGERNIPERRVIVCFTSDQDIHRACGDCGGTAGRPLPCTVSNPGG